MFAIHSTFHLWSKVFGFMKYHLYDHPSSRDLWTCIDATAIWKDILNVQVIRMVGVGVDGLDLGKVLLVFFMH